MSEVGKEQILARLRGHIARIEGAGASGRITIVSGAAPAPAPDPAVDPGPALADAHGRVIPLDSGPLGSGPAGALSLGVAEIDRRLPGRGLQFGRLHEVVGALEGAGTGFVVHLLRRLMGPGTGHGGPVFWLAPQDTLYAPGLACRGLDVDRLVMAVAPRREDRLWAMEESLRCPGVLAVVGELQGRETVDLTASRRLQLAAGQGGAIALLLRPPPPGSAAAPDGGEPGEALDGLVLGASAAVTRWHVRSLPAAGPAAAATPDDDDMGRRSRWRLALTRSRTGARHGWTVEVDHATGDFALAAPLRDRPGASDEDADRWAVA